LERMKRFVAAIFLWSSIGQAAKIEKLAEDYERTRKVISETERKQREVMASLYEINRKMKKTVVEKSGLESEKMLVEAQTQELAENVLELEGLVKNQKSLLRERLVTIYKMGGQGLARTLFASTSSVELEKNLKILGVVAKKDLQLIKDYKNNQRELSLKRNRFVKRLARLQKLESKISEREQQLTKQNQSKTQVLELMKSDASLARDQLRKLREKSKDLISEDERNLLDLLFKPLFADFRGKLATPVEGLVKQKFGVVRDPENQVAWNHKGVFFAAPESLPVRSVFDGTLAFADQVPGFGKTLIVDHGDHYYSVYSHVKEAAVEVGAYIRRNQVLAKVAQTSREFGSGIYFEIRHFSEPSDPLQWLKGIKK
jgi:septal ring factor EnvC (AmiA/AmiB activator)